MKQLECDTQWRYTPDVEQRVEGPVFCGVCKTQMEERRNVNGPTSMVEAMGRHKHLHDVFECPHREEVWHIQVISLRNRIRSTPSAAIAKIMQDEVEQILASQQATKEDFKGRHSQGL